MSVTPSPGFADDDAQPALKLWFFAGFSLIGFSFSLRLISNSFGYDTDAGDYPIALFISVFIAWGLFYLWLLQQLFSTGEFDKPAAQNWPLLIYVLLAGLAMRAMMFGSEPILENDFYRYLWDGALTANGHNPYLLAPQTIADGFAGDGSIRALAVEAPQVLERINHADLSTVYPLLAQAAFALAYFIKPFSLDAWRFVLLGLDTGVVLFLILILRRLEKPLALCLIYWWNPVVIKEVMNSAHMEPVLMVPLFAAIWLALNARFFISAVPLALAIGAKIWPVILIPSLYKVLNFKSRLAVGGIIAAILAGLFLPVITAGLNEHSGFIAYAKGWQASSALILIFNEIAGYMRILLGLGDDWQRPLTRLVLVALLGIFIIYKYFRQGSGAEGIIAAVFAVTVALYLISPTQFPWYFIWVAPFLSIFPLRALLLITALAPLHYVYFIWLLLDKADWHKWLDVWVMWVPVWLVLAYDLWRNPGRGRVRHA